MRIIFNVKHRLQFRDKLPASLTKLVLEAKGSISSTIKKHLHLVKISILAVISILKETPLAIETIYFTTESLAFQNWLLNGAHSVTEVKFPCSVGKIFETLKNNLLLAAHCFFVFLNNFIVIYRAKLLKSK